MDNYYHDKDGSTEDDSSVDDVTKPSPVRGKKKNVSSKKSMLSRAQIAGIAEGVKMPRRFKSAFIIYSSMRHSQIKKEFSLKGSSKKTTDIAKILSKEWKTMDPEDKAVWEEKSREDKARYDAEKAFFKFSNRGKLSKRIMKDHDAPKRPMSAFLAFSNERRAELKKVHPGVSNGGLSKLLSQQWKDICPERKATYVKKEAILREKYKADMAEFRKKKNAEAKMNKKLEDAQEVKKMEERLLRKQQKQQEEDNAATSSQAARTPDGVSSLRGLQGGNAVLNSLLGCGTDVSGISSMLLSGAGGGYNGMQNSLAGIAGIDAMSSLSASANPNERLALALSQQQLLDRLQAEQNLLFGNCQQQQQQQVLQNLQDAQNRSALEQALAGLVPGGGNVGMRGLYQPGFGGMDQQQAAADAQLQYNMEAQRRRSSMEAQRRSSFEGQHHRHLLDAHGHLGHHEGFHAQDKRFDF